MTESTLQLRTLWSLFKARYSALPQNDQRALLMLALFLIVTALYVSFWQPMRSWSETQKQNFQHQRAAYLWVSERIDQVTPATEPVQASSQTLSSSVAQSAQAAGLTLNRIQPNAQGVSVWLEKTPYPELLPWLKTLELEQQLTIEQIRIDRLPQDGLIKAFIQLRS